jgi:hypothetical protein
MFEAFKTSPACPSANSSIRNDDGYEPLVNWLRQGKPEVFGEKPTSPQFCQSQISTPTGPVSNPGFGDATPVTNCLRHDKDVSCSPISEGALIIFKVPRLGPFVFLIMAACTRR